VSFSINLIYDCPCGAATWFEMEDDLEDTNILSDAEEAFEMEGAGIGYDNVEQVLSVFDRIKYANGGGVETCYVISMRLVL
jgi:hypothetical protein